MNIPYISRRIKNKLRKILASTQHDTNHDSSNRMPTMQSSLYALLESGVDVETVLDVGVLTETKPLMEVFPTTEHHLFEPVSAHSDAIAANYKNIKHELHQLALSDHDGDAYLACKSINKDDTVSHSEVVSTEQEASNISGLIRYEKIKQSKLDTIIENSDIPAPYLLKIDVDGLELAILSGATSTLKKTSIIVIEAPINKVITPYFFERSSFLFEHGFYLLDIVDFAYYDGILWQVDLVFVRKDIVDNNDRLRPFEADSFSYENHKWDSLSDRINQM